MTFDVTRTPSIPASLRQAAAEDPDREAIVDGDLRLTFAELDDRVTTFARALIARGMRPGDRGAIWAPNSAFWEIAALGILAAGGILTPINTRFLGSEAQYALNRSRANFLLIEEGFLGKSSLTMLREVDTPAENVPDEVTADALIDTVPWLRTIVSTTPTATSEGIHDWESFTALADQVDPAEVDARIAAISSDDVSDILFTSGTTGHPKGAMVTHGSNLKTNNAWGDLVGLRAGDRYLLVNPMFHSFGYRAGMLVSIQKRATLYPVRTLDVAAALDLIEQEQITVLPGAPTLYTSIMNHAAFGSTDVSSVRLAVTGASVVPVPVIQRMRDELGFETILTAYGLTESCGTATVCPPDATLHRLSTTSGIAIPDTEVAIMGPDRQFLPQGEQGEIVIRGHNVMKGYFEDPAATAEAIDPDGWLHSGDVGWLDEDGYLTITDRIKDVITVGGFNVYPAEVERILLQHPAVSEAAVVGIPDPRQVEVPQAHITLRPGAHATEQELIDHCKGLLANFKVPRSVVIANDLPHTPSGKIQKFKLTGDHQ